MKNKKVPTSSQIIFSDLTSSFTKDNTRDNTIETNSHFIYGRNDIVMQIPKKFIKDLLWLCTKEVHFMYSNIIYQQNYCVAIRSPLVPVLSRIFIVEVETSIK